MHNIAINNFKVLKNIFMIQRLCLSIEIQLQFQDIRDKDNHYLLSKVLIMIRGKTLTNELIFKK